MPKLNLQSALKIKVAAGEILRLKGPGFSWNRPSPAAEPFFFGYNDAAIGDTNLPGGEGRVFLSRHVAPASGVLDYIRIYTPYNDGLLKGIVYSGTATAPTNLLAVGTEVATAANSWVQSNFAGQSITEGAYYWIGGTTPDWQAELLADDIGGVGWAQWGDNDYENPSSPISGGSSAPYRILAEVAAH